MFESLKHWYESVEKESRLFNHPDDEVIHIALASVLYHIIGADNIESNKEKKKFSSILKEEFGLDDAQVKHLYDNAKRLRSDFETDLRTIDSYLKDNPNLRMEFMNKINQLIDIDRVQESELAMFYETLHVIFPDLKTNY